MDFGFGPERWSCKTFGKPRESELGCTWMNEECTPTKLCCHEGMQCVQKDERAYCTPDAKMPGWNGTVLGGSRSEWEVQPVPKDAKNASGTSLFCFMAVIPGTHEDHLVNVAKKIGASIFACHAHGIYNSWKSNSTSHVFFNVWEMVRKDGRFNNHDWTVKVDPDAVFFPHGLLLRLKELRAPRWWPVYIKNIAEGVGFSGACEVFSNGAISKFFRYIRECAVTRTEHMGEDVFMKRCMDMIGAGYMHIDGMVKTVARGGACVDPGSVVFHPLDDVKAWEACHDEAMMP